MFAVMEVEFQSSGGLCRNYAARLLKADGEYVTGRAMATGYPSWNQIVQHN
jgi:hypothetical protein